MAPIVLLLSVVRSGAQEWPPDEVWAALPCLDHDMTDPYRDEPGAVDERDLVGDAEAPAGFRASDFEFAYFRMRLDQDPAPAGEPRPFAWGIELDLDGDRASYEAVLLVSGLDDTVSLSRNTTVTVPDDPSDPPDEPPVSTWPFAQAARTVEATGSSFGGDPDRFLDVAVPWTELAKVGVRPYTPLVAWLATSSNDNALDGDFVCHDGSSGDDKSLSGTAGSGTVLDPDVDSDGDGFSDAVEVQQGSDPLDGASVPTGVDADAPILEGAGGCRTAPVGGLALPAVLALLRRRRSRRA